MFNPDIVAIVDQETTVLAAELATSMAQGIELPDLLYYAADAAALADLVAHRSLRAPYLTDPQLDDILWYGYDLLRTFIRSRLEAASNHSARHQFADAALKNLNPASGMFAAFYVRFAETAWPPLATDGRHPGYTVGFETRHMGLRLNGSHVPACLSIGKAIYSRQEQWQILATCYDTCETYYVNAIDRFGEHNMASCLGRSWSTLYEALSTQLPLFRPPALSSGREWLGTALDQRAGTLHSNDHIHVAVQDNTFIPYVRVEMPVRGGRTAPGLPIREVVLPNITHRSQIQAVRAFFNLNGLATIAVREDAAILSGTRPGIPRGDAVPGG